MTYPWYEEVHYSNDITQGDVVCGCLIPLPKEELYSLILSESDQRPEGTIDIKQADIIVLSQVCDIENDKIDSIVACPIWPLKTLMSKNTYYASTNGKESLRQGKEPPYHLLNAYSSTNIIHDFSVVDFHRIYSLPKEFLKKVAQSIPYRLRLLPPYREHLSQAFARYFMRVGLPVDIEKQKIKELKI